MGRLRQRKRTRVSCATLWPLTSAMGQSRRLAALRRSSASPSTATVREHGAEFSSEPLPAIRVEQRWRPQDGSCSRGLPTSLGAR